MSLSIAKCTASCTVLSSPVRGRVLSQLLTDLDASVWNTGTPFLQLSDGGDWPRPGKADGDTHLSPAGQHKPPTERDCTNRPGCELEQHPFCCSWRNYEAEVKGNSTFCGCNQIHQRPSVKGHKKLLRARDTFKSRRGCSWQQHAASLCHVPFSCSSLWFLSWFSVELFLGEGEVRHTEYLSKEFI